MKEEKEAAQEMVNEMIDLTKRRNNEPAENPKEEFDALMKKYVDRLNKYNVEYYQGDKPLSKLLDDAAMVYDRVFITTMDSNSPEANEAIEELGICLDELDVFDGCPRGKTANYIRNLEEHAKTQEELVKELSVGVDLYKKALDFSEARLKKYDDWLSGRDFMNWMRDQPPTAKEPSANERRGYIYLLHTKHGVKIGRSINVTNRIERLKIQLPFKVTEVNVYQVEEHGRIEGKLHREYKHKRLNGEWFKLDTDEIKEIQEYLTSIEV